jgi:hypothetical protein
MSRYAEIEKEINNLKPLANIEVATVPYNSRTGVESLKNQSITQIETLTKEYAELVKKNAVFVVLDGSDNAVDEFVEEASASFDALSIDATTWDSVVGEGWWEALGKQSGLTNTVHVIQLLDAIRKTMVDLSLTEVETPNIPQNVAVNSEQDAIGIVHSVTTSQCGGSFRSALWLDEAVHTASVAGWSGEDNQPILFLVKNASPEEATAVSSVFPKTYTIKVSAKTVSEKGVENALTNIAKKLKK